MKNDKKSIWKIASISGFLATLCCLSPLVLVLFGLSTASFAVGFGDILFKEYWWVFVIIGLLTLGLSLKIYFRTKYNICTIDEAKKQRKKVINTSLLTLIAFVCMYILFEIVLQAIWVELGWSSWQQFTGGIASIFKE